MLSFHSVVKRFDKIRAVDDLSFSMQKGEIFALLGPNGAGKTSCIRMIMQVMSPDSGTIEFDESLLTNGSIDRSKLGYLPEERGLYQDASLLKTLIYLAELRGADPGVTRKRAEEWLSRFDLLDRKNDKISTLSKGNQQKVQFISSILHKPKFAILDEPFSGFDPINQEFISDLIRELRDDGMTILLSAHQMQLVEKIADRILMLNLGKQLHCGTLDEIRSSIISHQKLIVSYQNAVDVSRLRDASQIKQINEEGDRTFEIFISNESSINDILTLVASAGDVANLKTSEVTLHEIFLESFKNGGPDHE